MSHLTAASDVGGSVRLSASKYSPKQLRQPSASDALCQGAGQRPRAREQRALRVFAKVFDTEVAPRQASLPESWDARSLDDDAISKELQRIKLSRRSLATQSLSLKRLRSVRNKRLKFRASSSATGTDETLRVKPGKFLSAEQQAKLCFKWQEWQRMQGCLPPLSSSAAEHMAAWAKAAGKSEAELAKIETEGLLAAHLLLASVERLLYKICIQFQEPGSEIDDSLAEARTLWLEAASKCNPAKASLTSFGVMYLHHRLPSILHRQRHLLQKPPNAVRDETIVHKAIEELEEAELLHTPTVDEIAKKAKVSTVTVRHVLQRSRGMLSLDQPAADHTEPGSTVADHLVGENLPEQDGLSSAMQSEMEATLMEFMETNIKNDEDRDFFALYYGLDQGDVSRQWRGLKPWLRCKEIAKLNNCSAEKVRKSVIKARAHLNKNGAVSRKMREYLEAGVFAEVESPGHVSDVSADERKLG